MLTMILWGSHYPIFQATKRRLKELIGQLYGWPSIEIQDKQTPNSLSFSSNHFATDIRKFYFCAIPPSLRVLDKWGCVIHPLAYSCSCPYLWYIKSRGPSLDHRHPFLTYNWELPFMFLPTTVKLLYIYFIVIIIFIILTITQYIPSVLDETCRRWKILGWVGMLQIVSVLFISILIFHGPYFYMQFKEQVA